MTREAAASVCGRVRRFLSCVAFAFSVEARIFRFDKDAARLLCSELLVDFVLAQLSTQ